MMDDFQNELALLTTSFDIEIGDDARFQIVEITTLAATLVREGIEAVTVDVRDRKMRAAQLCATSVGLILYTEAKAKQQKVADSVFNFAVKMAVTAIMAA